MEVLLIVSILIFNVSIGNSIFRLLNLTTRSKWDIAKFKHGKVDFALFLISGVGLLIFFKSIRFQNLIDWILVFSLGWFSFEKLVLKSTDAKHNSVLFLISIFLVLFLQIELISKGGKHISAIDPLIVMYSSFVNGMVIYFLFSETELPNNAGRYLFYAVFFKAYLYFSKLIISWYTNFPKEISWISLQTFPHNLFLILVIVLGIVMPFVIYFPFLLKSNRIMKFGLYLILLSSVFEMVIIYGN